MAFYYDYLFIYNYQGLSISPLISPLIILPISLFQCLSLPFCSKRIYLQGRSSAFRVWGCGFRSRVWNTLRSIAPGQDWRLRSKTCCQTFVLHVVRWAFRAGGHHMWWLISNSGSDDMAVHSCSIPCLSLMLRAGFIIPSFSFAPAPTAESMLRRTGNVIAPI